jgi:large repetitive protein
MNHRGTVDGRGRRHRARPPWRNGARIVATIALFSAGLTTIGTTSAPSAQAAAVDPPLQCDENIVYGLEPTSGASVNTANELWSIDVRTGVATKVKLFKTTTPSTRSAGNGLGITANGLDAWAVDYVNGSVMHYDTTTGAITIAALSAWTPSTVPTMTQGAINPATGTFYYGSTVATTANFSQVPLNDAYLGAYDPATSTLLGRVGLFTNLAAGNGDLVFTQDGRLVNVSASVLSRLDQALPTTAVASGSQPPSLTTTQFGTLTGLSGTGASGIAYAGGGYLYLSNAGNLVRYDQVSNTTSTQPIVDGNGAGVYPVDLASCNFPRTVRVGAVVHGRQTPDDQFGLSVTGTGINSGNSTTTSGIATGTQAAVAGPVAVLTGNTYTITQTPSGATDLAKYTTTWSCVDSASPSTVLAAGTGNSGSFQFPTGSATYDIACTFTDSPIPTTVAATVALSQDRLHGTDQFTAAWHQGTATGTVLNATDASTTAGSGSTVSAGTGTTGATNVPDGQPLVLTQTLAPGADTGAAAYRTTISCTDANGLQTGLPTNAPFTGSFAVTPVLGSAISCTLTNSVADPTVTVTAALTGQRVAGTDQFTVALRTGGTTGTVVNPTTNDTTSGTGSTVVTGSGTTGTLTATAGTTYTATQSVSAHSSLYGQTVSCLDANNVQTGLPQGVAFSGSVDITPVGGAAIGCTVTNSATATALGLAIADPATLAVDTRSSYRLTVTNTGGAAATPTVAVRLPAAVAYTGTTGTGWSCAATGTVADGQTVSCTGPSVPGGGTTSDFSIAVTPQAAAAGRTVGARAAVDATGGSAPAAPSSCTGTDTPSVGCAISAGVPVSSGVGLTAAIGAPAGLTDGEPADYTVTIANTGPATASSAAFDVQLPAGVRYSSASGAICTATGQRLHCTTSGPVAPAGSTGVVLTVLPDSTAVGSAVAVAVAVDPDGGSTPQDPATCTTNTGGCAISTPRTVDGVARLTLTATAPTDLLVGRPATYDFSVGNGGSGSAASATVAVVLPADVQFTSAAGATCVAGTPIVCTVPGPITAGGTAAFSTTVTPTSAARGSSAQLTAAIDPTGSGAPRDPAGCTATGSPAGCAVAPRVTVQLGPTLSLQVQNPASVAVGATSDFGFSVVNDGDRTDPGPATVVDLLPAGFDYVSADGATCSAVGQRVTCTVSGPFAGGVGTTHFSIRTRPQESMAGRQVVNRATVGTDSSTPPVDPATCVATGAPAGCAVPSSVTIGSGISLELTVQDPPALVSGVDAPLRFTVRNVGTGPAASATVVTVLPEGLTYDRVSGATCAATGRTVTCTVPGPIAPDNGSATFSIVAVPSADAAGNALSAAAAVDSTGGTAPVAPATCTGPACAATRSATVLTAALTVSVAAAPVAPATDPVAVGDVVGYTYTVRNTGTAALRGIAVASSGLDGISCAADSLAAGANTTCTTRRAVTQADVDSGVVSTTATASATCDGCETVASPPARADTATVTGAALTVTLTAGDAAGSSGTQRALRVPAIRAASSTTAGGTIHYVTTIANTGVLTLHDLAVTYSLPVTDAVCGGAIASLAPTATVTCSADHQVTDAENAAGSVENSVTVAAVGPDDLQTLRAASSVLVTDVPSGPGTSTSPPTSPGSSSGSSSPPTSSGPSSGTSQASAGTPAATTTAATSREPSSSDAAPPTTSTVTTTTMTTTAAAGPVTGTLPNTGVPAERMLLAALGLLAAGSVLALVGRIRRTGRQLR